MKKYSIVVIISSVLSAGLLFSQAVRDFPSQRLSKPQQFLLVSTEDMRTFLCERSTLSNRIARHVCLIDRVHVPGPKDVSLVQEVAVEEGMSLEQLLRKVNLYETGSQIRLFTQNSIQQSPILKRWDDPEAARFRATRIVPGDIVVLTRTREW